MALYDAHNHLQDPKLAEHLIPLEKEISGSRIGAMVINGTRRSDWDAVLAIAARHTWAVPSIGYHPWFLDELSENWREQFEECVSLNGVAVGEIGVDGRKPGLDWRLQREVCLFQLEIAQRLAIPVSIHGLKAWAELLELVKRVGDLPGGFLLHSYSGDRSHLRAFVERGGYFSCAAAFLEPKRVKAFELFKEVPIERILIETDAPDQRPPRSLDSWALTQSRTGDRLTHPLSIALTYDAMAKARGIETAEFEAVIEANFQRLFGRITQARRV